MSSANDTSARPASAGCAIPEHDFWFLKAIHSAVLVAATRGMLDLNQLARTELIRRGLDPAGDWVGRNRARELHTHHITKEQTP